MATDLQSHYKNQERFTFVLLFDSSTGGLDVQYVYAFSLLIMINKHGDWEGIFSLYSGSHTTQVWHRIVNYWTKCPFAHIRLTLVAGLWSGIFSFSTPKRNGWYETHNLVTRVTQVTWALSSITTSSIDFLDTIFSSLAVYCVAYDNWLAL